MKSLTAKCSIFRLIKCGEGVAAVEYALFLPVLVTLLAGIVDYGMYIHSQMTLQELARAAAEYVVQGGDPADLQANVFDGSTVAGAAAAEGRTVTYDDKTECECAQRVSVACNGSCGSGDYVRTFYTVTVSSRFTPILPYPGLGDGVDLEGYASLQYRE
jgi:Flp pilus assembly protein TadG